MTVHHAVADGASGVDVLRRLADAPPPPARRARPPAPGALRRAARIPARLRDAVAELRAGPGGRAPRCSLVRPVGPHRRLAVARADLSALRARAHAAGATLTDVLLAAAGGALGVVLAARGESVPRLVVAVPVAARGTAAAGPGATGNAVGLVRVVVPTTGPRDARLAEVRAARARAGPGAHPGASQVLLAAGFRLLRRAGLLDAVLARQRRVTTLVSSVRGPEAPLTVLGLPVVEVLPVSPTLGNVTVVLCALSYAGRLAVTVVADADACPDLPVLASALQAELDG